MDESLAIYRSQESFSPAVDNITFNKSPAIVRACDWTRSGVKQKKKKKKEKKKEIEEREREEKERNIKMKKRLLLFLAKMPRFRRRGRVHACSTNEVFQLRFSPSFYILPPPSSPSLIFSFFFSSSFTARNKITVFL